MRNLDEELEKKIDEKFEVERWRWHTSGEVDGGLAVLAVLGLEKEERIKVLAKALRVTNKTATELVNQFYEEKKSVLYTDMIDLIIQISDHVFAGRETVRKGVEETMGGKVLKLKSERLREEGWREGKEQGLAEGKAEGMEFQKLASIKKLMKNGGMSLEQAMRILEIPIEEQGIYEEKLNY